MIIRRSGSVSDSKAWARLLILLTLVLLSFPSLPLLVFFSLAFFQSHLANQSQFVPKTELMVVAPIPVLRKIGDLLLHVDSCSITPSHEIRNLSIPHTRLKNFGDRAFSVAAETLWNSLPSNIHNAPTLDTFKSFLKTHLFTCLSLSLSFV